MNSSSDRHTPRHRRLFIVTGASRGLGFAMAQRLLEQPDVELLAISRKPGIGLAGPALTQWALDLAQPLQAAARLQAWLVERDGGAYASATLVNNAALMPPLAPIDHNDSAVLAETTRVGLEAPLLLTAAFLRATRSWSGARRVLNISSGLGRRPMAGSAPYGAVKAGLDHFSRIVALDEANAPNGAKVVALAPGVIDTDMQTEMRNADAASFPERERVLQMKENGLLDTPETAAEKVLNHLERPDFGDTVLADVHA
jgi:NAD(P)-dependent dehydrogenase (short-subunit alcohol dehydrogenase family)